VTTIGAIQYINLVRLRGFWAKRLLVYDNYMPKGSLQSLLRQKNPLISDWKATYPIAIGTAEGLAYLQCLIESRLITGGLLPVQIRGFIMSPLRF
jgi:hypothetical protein